VKLDDEGRIAEEVACRACGRGLLGVEATAPCPECGSEIILHGELLSSCSPSWVRVLSSAARVLAVLNLLGLATIIVLAAIETVPDWTSGNVGARVSYATLSVAVALVVWFFTQPDPGRTTPEPILSARRVCRWGIAAEVPSVVVEMFISHGGLSVQSSGVERLVVILLTVLYMLSMILTTTGTAALIFHMRALARRVPDDRLDRSTRRMGYGFITAMIALSLAGITFAPFQTVPLAQVPPAVSFVVAGAFLVGFLGAVIFLPWSSIVLWRYGRVLRAQASE
jgi:hypothetical protein